MKLIKEPKQKGNEKMSKIYIKNLYHNKAAICRALFDAAEKTEKGKSEKKLGIQTTANVSGLWSALENYEIEQELWKSRHDGLLLDMGYLQVKLHFEIDSVDVSFYEETYGISAKQILEKAGYTCSDKPFTSNINESYSSPLQSKTLYVASKSYENKEPVENKFKPYSKDIALDKRFKKSTEDGVFFEATSISYVSDDELKALGAKCWKRPEKKKGELDNKVLILEMLETPQASQKPKMK